MRKTSTTETKATPTEEMRSAATKLRETAKGATPGRWSSTDPVRREFGGLDFPIASDHLLSSPPYVAYVDVSPQAVEFPQQVADAKADALWIALAGPSLAEPLAEWLEMEAHMAEKRGLSAEGNTFHALKVARIVNAT